MLDQYEFQVTRYMKIYNELKHDFSNLDEHKKLWMQNLEKHIAVKYEMELELDKLYAMLTLRERMDSTRVRIERFANRRLPDPPSDDSRYETPSFQIFPQSF